jgi:hypothetical protein
MTRPRYLPSVSLGNIITILAFSLGLALAWGEKNSDVRQLAASDVRHDSALEKADLSIRTLERGQDRIMEQLSYIKSTMDRLDKKLP